MDYSFDAHLFVTLNSFGVLSTHSKSNTGYPFGSVVPYDIDEQGRIVIFIANISEHFKNLKGNSKASICVMDYYGASDPQANARATIMGEFVEVPENEIGSVRSSYWSRFPNATDRSIEHTFVYFRAVPEKIRWIGGFGNIGWIQGDKFTACKRDLISYSGLDILKHMNQDHADALEKYVKNFSQIDPSGSRLTMTAISSKSFTIRVEDDNQQQSATIEFNPAINSLTEVRTRLIEMLKLGSANKR